MMNSHHANVAAIILILFVASGCAENEVEIERDRESIRSTVREHAPEIRDCYNQHLESHPDAEGRVVVRFVVHSSGTVNDVMMETNELGSTELGDCIMSAVADWTFPAVEGDGLTIVSYPFILRREADSEATSAGELNRDSIRAAFAEANPQIRYCYEAGLQENSELAGRVTARLTIAEDGTVSSVSLDDSTLESDEVNACLEERISEMTFPDHTDGEVTVNYPLVFRAN